MANPRGIFTLKGIVTQKILGESVPLDEVFITTIGNTPIGPNVGYFYGGSVPSPMPDPGSKSIVGKIDFSADTASRVPTADLTDIGYSFSGNLPNRTDLYIIGGRIGVPGALGDGCQKLTFASNTISPVPGGSLSAASYQSASVYNGGISGYMVGGSNPSFTSEIQKFEYASETASTITDQIPVARNRMASIGSVDAGYIFGGNPGSTSEFIKFEYSTESISPIPARTPGGSAANPYAQDGGGVSNTTTGYYMPGYFLQSEMSKFTFSTENPSLLPGVGFTPGSGRPSTSGNTTQGYFALPSGPGTSPETTIYKMNYSTDGLSPIPGTSTVAGRREGGGGGPRSFSLPGQLSALPIVNQFKTNITPQPNIGYSLGGTVPAYTNKINKFDMSTETASNPGSTLPQPQGYAGNAASRTDTYLFGGTHSASPYVFADCYTVEYSTETADSIPGANLTAARYGCTSTSSLDAAYTAGGRTPSTVSRMDKMTYSDETTLNVPGGPLSRVDYYMSSFGDQDHGYFGATADVTSNYDRLAYFNDTVANLPGMTLSFTQRGNSAVTGDGFAFIAGGPSGTSTYIERAEFSTETISYTPSANLVKSDNKYMFTFSNNDAGYFAGGDAPTQSTSIDKLTYSTSTTATNPAQLVTGSSTTQGSSPRKYNTSQVLLPTPTPQTANVITPVGPTPSYDFGYTLGGPAYTGNYKINFSDDTFARTSTDLTEDIYGTATHSSSTHGYLTGGRAPSGDYKSYTTKISYADDTMSSGGDYLFGSQYFSGSSTNTTASYIFGGGRDVTPWRYSSTGKYTYSSDSSLLVPTAETEESQQGGAFGNATTGYMLSANPSYLSYKLTYSDETAESNSFIPNSLITTRPTCASSPSGGYVMGGSAGTMVSKTEFSTDSTERIPSADLPTGAQSFSGGMGSTTAGYVCGGYPGIGSTIQKVNFVTSTSSALTPLLDTSEYWRSHVSSKTNHVPGISSAPVIC